MRLNAFEDDIAYTPRSERVSFDMQVRLRCGKIRASAQLKNVTTGGARVDGMQGLRCGDRVTLYLPKLKPKLAMVAWIVGDAAGLEFERPLHPSIFETLVLHHAQWRELTETDRTLRVVGKDYSAPVEDLRNAA